MLVVKPWFDEVGCEYVGMEGKRSLFITLGSRKYSWFHTLPWFYTLLKEKLRNILRIKTPNPLISSPQRQMRRCFSHEPFRILQ
jgi:hypothetical protein